MPSHIVDANYRFIAAYNEVNARIAQRQQALALYVSIVIGLLAATVALRPSGTAPQAPVEWLVLGFPVASICFAFLNYKAELAITNLRTYLSVLEQLGDAHTTLPSYNTDPQWSLGANEARRFHDYTVAVLVAAGNFVGLGANAAIFPTRFAQAPTFMYASGVLALVSFIVVLMTSRWHYAPKATA
ncbi:MAG: hypothetical protein QM749_08520 [Aquabacterium sp.]